MWNALMDEAEAGIKIAGRNINNLRYADDTTLMAESEEELKSLLMKVKEESEKVGLNLFFVCLFVFFKFIYLFIYLFILNFKIFNSYMRSQTWTPLPPPSP